MATVEHCLYCFESLAANLENRASMSLYQVQASWSEYPKGLDESENNTEASDDDDDDDDDDDEDEEVDNEAEDEVDQEDHTTVARPKQSRVRRPGLGGLGRLSAAVRSSGSRNNDSATTLGSSSASLATTTTTTTTSASASTRASSLGSGSGSGSSSNTSFTPPGMGRRTSQRGSTISESPLFVTWNTLSPSGPSPSSSSASSSSSPPSAGGVRRTLRGCIGTFEAQPLAGGLATFAVTSALADTRFAPVTRRELPRLEVAVTLLTDFEECADPMDWELGVHGLRISFYHHHRRYGSTYLPDVAVEQGWGKEETLVSLMRKAGWLGRREKWRDVGALKVVRYQGKRESADHEEFQKWRAWVTASGKK